VSKTPRLKGKRSSSARAAKPQLELALPEVEIDAKSEPALRPWPKPTRFPYNYDGNTVGDVVIGDLGEAEEALIITGFTSLDYLLYRLPQLAMNKSQPLRIALGHEPHATKRKRFPTDVTEFARDVQDYWLEQGFSLLESFPTKSREAVFGTTAAF
jgi:hypothetical protein